MLREVLGKTETNYSSNLKFLALMAQQTIIPVNIYIIFIYKIIPVIYIYTIHVYIRTCIYINTYIYTLYMYIYVHVYI